MSGYAGTVVRGPGTGALRAAVAAVLAAPHRMYARPGPGGLAERAGTPDGSSTPWEPGPAGTPAGTSAPPRPRQPLAPPSPGVPQPAPESGTPESGTPESGTPESGTPESGTPDSWQLVRAAQAGDVEAFGRLYDRYVDVVFRYVWHRLGDRVLAEDLTSETFLRALRRIGSVSYRGSDVAAWFVTIARNLVIDHVKSARHRREVVTGDMPEAGQVDAGPEPEVLRRTTNAELLRCVRQLAADQQECIVLRFLDGLSVTETAQVMGRTDGAVKALQRRAVRRLAELLPAELR